MLDELDRSLIKILEKEGRATLKDISEQVHLSIPATRNRINKLEDTGYIKGYTVVLSMDKFQKPLSCFCLIEFKDQTDQEDKEFIEYANLEDDIIECHRLAGSFEYMLKINTDSTTSLENILVNIRGKWNVDKTITHALLSTIKTRSFD